MPLTQRLPPDAAGLEEAARLILAGGLVAFPTETVYGLGADATDGQAVARIFEAKGRPRFNPLIAHLAVPSWAEDLAELGEVGRRLADRFWPGPLTLVAPLRRPSPLSDLVTAGLETVALRVPAHPLAQALLGRVGRSVAAPSANPSGRVSPTTAEHVLEGLDGRIDAVVDGGVCSVGLESTIVGVFDGPQLLRPGGVEAEAVQAALGVPLALPTGGGVTAPGQLASHYAPRARLRLGAKAPVAGEAWLGFGPDPEGLGAIAETLSARGDLREAASALFATLRLLDGKAAAIAVAPIPEHGLGRAINDRLRRAAAPRPDG